MQGAAVSSVAPGFRLLSQEFSENVARLKVLLPGDTPLVAGHFPGRPILPGVAELLLVEGAGRALLGDGVSIRALKGVRYRQVVRPGDILEVALRGTSCPGEFRFEVTSGASLVANGSVELGELP